MTQQPHLVDELAAEWVLLIEDLGPEVGVHALDDVARLHLEEGVAVGAVDERVVAGAALVGDAGQVGVALLAVLADHGGVVVGVGGQEVLGVVVAVHDDLAQRVVHRRVRGTLRHQVL